MATHSSKLAWKSPWTGESCRQQSMGSQRIRHDLVIKQQQQPTPTPLIAPFHSDAGLAHVTCFNQREITKLDSNRSLKKVHAPFLFLSQNSASALRTCLMEGCKRHMRSHPSQVSPRSTSSSQPSI